MPRDSFNKVSDALERDAFISTDRESTLSSSRRDTRTRESRMSHARARIDITVEYRAFAN